MTLTEAVISPFFSHSASSFYTMHDEVNFQINYSIFKYLCICIINYLALFPNHRRHIVMYNATCFLAYFYYIVLRVSFGLLNLLQSIWLKVKWCHPWEIDGGVFIVISSKWQFSFFPNQASTFRKQYHNNAAIKVLKENNDTKPPPRY